MFVSHPPGFCKRNIDAGKLCKVREKWDMMCHRMVIYCFLDNKNPISLHPKNLNPDGLPKNMYPLCFVYQLNSNADCPLILPSSSFLRTPVVPCSVLLRSRFGLMERREKVENVYRVGKNICRVDGGTGFLYKSV